MDTTEPLQRFLDAKPPFSKTSVEKNGKKWRNGEPFDEQVIDSFLTHNALLLDRLLSASQTTIDSLILPLEMDQSSPIQPASSNYRLSARVKTTTTLREKLRRMARTPLHRIQDIAGIRLDCDVTLHQQTKIAEAFADNFQALGAKKADLKDFRTEPHSGYRAIHIHIQFQAGLAEMQIRTALQSKWANLYEEAADIIGRDIRYLHEGAQTPPEFAPLVQELLGASDKVRFVEEETDELVASGNPAGNDQRTEIYGMLDDIHSKVASLRKKKD